MALELARADLPTSSDWKLVLVLMYAGILAVTGVLVFIPIRLAKGRRRRPPELLTAAAVLWAVVCAGAFLYASTQQLNWSHEQTTLIESGYYDPQDTSAAPKWPWIGTAIIAGAYAALIAWSLARASAPPTSSIPGPRTPG